MSNSLQPYGLQHSRLPCPSPTPGDCSNSCPSSQWCQSKQKDESRFLREKFFKKEEEEEMVKCRTVLSYLNVCFFLFFESPSWHSLLVGSQTPLPRWRIIHLMGQLFHQSTDWTIWQALYLYHINFDGLWWWRSLREGKWINKPIDVHIDPH